MTKRFWHHPRTSAYLFGVVIALITYPFTQALAGQYFIGGILSGCLGGLGNFFRLRYLDTIAKRQSDANEVVWDIEINMVKVGTISDSELASIELCAGTDVKNYVNQFINVFKMLFASVEVVLSLPVVLFWGCIGVAVFAPDLFTSTLTDMKNASPADVVQVIKASVQLAVPVWLTVFLSLWIMGLRFGFRNYFEEDVALQLRRRTGTAADGQVALTRLVEGWPVIYDRSEEVHRFMRAKKSKA
jgi:hypothetical protein